MERKRGFGREEGSGGMRVRDGGRFGRKRGFGREVDLGRRGFRTESDSGWRGIREGV